MSATAPGIFPIDAPASGNRVLLGGIAVSIALHGAVLVLFPGTRDRAPAASPVTVLTATLGPRNAAPEPAPAAVPEVQARASEPPPKPRVKPPPEPPPPSLSRPPREAPARVQEAPAAAPAAPVAPPAQTASVALPVAAPSAAPAPEAKAPQTSTPVVPAPSQATAKPSDAVDAGAADKYRLALIAAASRSKTYPRGAMEKGWHGKVEVRVIVSPFGNFRSVTVKTSSGHQILDNEALKIVRGAQRARDLTVPDALRGKEFTVDVPVIFDLQTG